MEAVLGVTDDSVPDAAGFTEQVSRWRPGLALDSGTLTRSLLIGRIAVSGATAAVARPARHRLSALVDAARTAGCRSPRGAGTSIAGNAVGPGLVLDCSRLDRIAHVDRSPAPRSWSREWFRPD